MASALVEAESLGFQTIADYAEDWYTGELTFDANGVPNGFGSIIGHRETDTDKFGRIINGKLYFGLSSLSYGFGESVSERVEHIARSGVLYGEDIPVLSGHQDGMDMTSYYNIRFPATQYGSRSDGDKLNTDRTGGYLAAFQIGNPFYQRMIGDEVKVIPIVGSLSDDMYNISLKEVFAATPVIEDGRTLIPVRPIADSIGGTTSWDGTTKTVTVDANGKTMSLTIGNTTATLNGTSVTMDVPAKIIGGKTMVPLRFITENLLDNIEVVWVEKAKQVVLTTPEQSLSEETSRFSDFWEFKEYYDSHYLEHPEIENRLVDGKYRQIPAYLITPISIGIEDGWHWDEYVGDRPPTLYTGTLPTGLEKYGIKKVKATYYIHVEPQFSIDCWQLTFQLDGPNTMEVYSDTLDMSFPSWAGVIGKDGKWHPANENGLVEAYKELNRMVYYSNGAPVYQSSDIWDGASFRKPMDVEPNGSGPTYSIEEWNEMQAEKEENLRRNEEIEQQEREANAPYEEYKNAISESYERAAEREALMKPEKDALAQEYDDRYRELRETLKDEHWKVIQQAEQAADAWYKAALEELESRYPI
jgi:hypothetical protein